MAGITVVAGCDAVDAGADWVRLHVTGGPLRTIAWAGISMAALLRNDEHMTFEGDLEQITALRATHDPLWIESGDGVAVALLEKQHPKRDAILAAFQERLGARWQGDRLTAQEAAMRMFKAPNAARAGFQKMAIIAAVSTLLLALAGLVIARLSR